MGLSLINSLGTPQQIRGQRLDRDHEAIPG
jgi:hypothetical protein